MAPEELQALKVTGEFHWGYSIRAVSESAAAHPYMVPPPSTLIGALSYGLTRVRGLSECTNIEGKLASRTLEAYSIVSWATFGLQDERKEMAIVAHGYSDPVRLFRLPYQRGARHEWAQRDMWFGVAAHGKTYYPTGGFKILYLIRKREAEEILGGDYQEILLRSCASICRLGSREGLVSIESVELSEDLQRINPPARTSLYFPARLVVEIEEERGEDILLPILTQMRDALIFRGVSLWMGDHERYILPVIARNVRAPGELEIHQLAEEGALLKVAFPKGEEIVVIPKEILEGDT